MPDPMTLEEIRKFWSEQATRHGPSPSASWSDHRAIDMEIAEILARLDDGDRVLDVGCANGFSTAQFAMSKRVSVLGVDYIPEMVRSATERTVGLPADVRERLQFAFGDVMNLAFPDGHFDKVVVIRVIINLGSVEDQVRGMRECARVVRRGGRLLMSEATLQGWMKLNRLRGEWGLPDIAMPRFNNYLDQEGVVAALLPTMRLVEIADFASTYFVGTRVLKPLIAKACGLALDVADPGMEWNRWFSLLPAAGDYGTQKLFVFEKV